jgi:carbamoyl-phosphate synthase small subunit
MTNKPAILVLADGTIYEGISVGAAGDCVGELVFNTSMTGYQEMLSDPSYARQIITLTTAHVGNTGCNPEDMESNKVWAAGLVMRDSSIAYSNYRAKQSLPDWLKKNGVVAIADIDTRAVTIRLRTHGAIAACISTDVDNPLKALEKAKSFAGLENVDLAKEVSRHTSERWDEGEGLWVKNPSIPLKYNVVAYDFGVKSNILRLLYDRGCHITVVPAQTPASEVLALNPDGICLSNGPADPKACTYAIAATKEFLE